MWDRDAAVVRLENWLTFKITTFLLLRTVTQYFASRRHMDDCVLMSKGS